ncbi:glycoside hydrolase family 3 N-terminal domain-containing protein [Sphaerochaeta halotolerans]|uniref:glycoside hydrolase family 3 N-terminal domain-containing protein n=1 Tax=Sphaerochaeta halotolerans TaxID=2293840 RepID=UPI00136F298E|nr:glycoside hydrolase family 3 N-terminal domain-containing protein [Sphaerochaeta halotolerans]MXI85342.1 beta-glucosidase [Sphaerochaeta halotolerans]
MQQNKERALELLRKMSIEEKVSQLVSAWLEIGLDGSLHVREYGHAELHDGDVKAEVLRKGIGQLTRPYGTMANDAVRQAKAINELQRYLLKETRLGIPALLHEECLTGAMVKGATIFPSALNYGSTWEPSLVGNVGKAIGDELRSLGVHQGLAPVLDVARDARWGRLEETYGEDPYLCGVMGIAYVQGLQGERRSPIATLKHFVGHSASEGGRNHAPVHIGPTELRNTFALPFEMVVRHAHPGSVMPAYHDIDGVPCTSNRSLITDLLKHQWGFDGLVVADYEAIVQLFHDHRVASDMAEAAALAFNAGMDIELPGYTVFKEGLIEALYRGLITNDALDEAVLRVLQEKYNQGVFEHPFIKEDAIELGTEKNHALAVEVAEKSLVLLKNDGTLPLKQAGSVALVGPLADHPYAMFGGYSTPIHLQGSHGPEETVPLHAKTIRAALSEVLGDVPLTFEPGCMLYESKVEKAIFFPGDVPEEEEGVHELSQDTQGIEKAVAAAVSSDVTVMVVGDIAGLFRQGTVGEGSDADSLKLPGVQEQLMEAVLATGKPVVVVLVSGRPYTMHHAVSQASAILATWLPGEGGGEAIARTLVGLNNPGGKTILSFPKCAGSMPYAYNHFKKAGGLKVQPKFGALYPFGHGLSYTTFDWDDFQVENPMIQGDEEFHFSLTVRNGGTCGGDEVVQVYLQDKVASIVRPVKELKAFCRVPLQPGEQKRISFTLPADILSFVGSDARRVLEPGSFLLQVGKSSEDIVFNEEIAVVGKSKVFSKDWRFLSSVSVTDCT